MGEHHGSKGEAGGDLSSVLLFAGFDHARIKDYSALAVGEVDPLQQPSPLLMLRGVKQWPHVDYEAQLDDLRNMHKFKRFSRIAVDATSELAFIERLQSFLPIWPVRYTAKVKEEMVNTALQLKSQDLIRFPKSGLEELERQIREYEMRVRPSGNVEFTHPSGQHDDQLQAFLLLCLVAVPTLKGASRPALARSEKDTERRNPWKHLTMRPGISIKETTRWGPR